MIVGIDLAKTTLSVHAVDVHGKTALHNSLARLKLLEFKASIEPCLVGMEAHGTAHSISAKYTSRRVFFPLSK